MVLADLVPSRLYGVYGRLSGVLRVLLHPLVLIGAITLFGAVLRLYSLDRWSFWIDEYYTVRSVDRIINLGNPSRITNYLVLLTFNQFGLSEWSARLVPAIVGILTIPVFYVFTRRMFNAATATLAALLLAVAPWHLYWSQNARFYTMLLLFFMLGMMTLYEGVERKSPWWLGLSVIFTGLAIWESGTSLVALGIIAAYLAYKFVLHRPPQHGLRIPSYVVPLALLAVLVSVPLALVIIPDLVSTLFTKGQFAQPNNSALWILMGVVFYVRIPVICTAIVGAAFLLVRRRPAGILAALWAILPLVTLLALTFFTYTANRYVFPTLPAWILLASFAVVELFTQTRDIRLKLLVLALPLLLLADSMGENVLYYRYQNGNRDDWKGAIEFVQAHRQPGEMIITTKPEIVKFYLDEPAFGFSEIDSFSGSKPDQRIWFLEDMNIGQEKESHRTWMQQHAQQVAVFDNWVGGRNFRMRVFLYDPQFPPVISSATVEP